MSTLVIKHRKFELKEELNENESICTYKGVDYLVKKYEPKSDEFELKLYKLNRISSAGFPTTKVIYVDKKQGYIVCTLVRGETVFDILCKQDLPETFYDKIFSLAWIAKNGGITVDFSPVYWVHMNDDLYYVGEDFKAYSEDNDFANKGVRLWFFTKEFVELAKQKNVDVDLSRLKDSYTINKEIVLIACKYYR